MMAFKGLNNTQVGTPTRTATTEHQPDTRTGIPCFMLFCFIGIHMQTGGDRGVFIAIGIEFDLFERAALFSLSILRYI